MAITRKRFLGVAAGGGAGLLLGSCGGGGYGGGSNTPTSSCGATIGAPIHGHSMTIAVADLNSTTDKTYDIRGTATHTHAVTLTTAQLGQLKSGTLVNVTSTPGDTDNHTHAVAVSCIIY